MARGCSTSTPYTFGGTVNKTLWLEAVKFTV
jgi:hypothetical protein